MAEREALPQGFAVEVIYARQEVQAVVTVQVPPAATLMDAVRLSGLAQRFPEIDLDRLDAGIFGRPAAADSALRPGDRVEIYRPLLASPKEMRRRRAKQSR